MPLRFEYIYARLRASEPAWSKWVKGLVAIIRALWSVHDIALQIAQAALPPPEPPGGVDPDNSADESSDDSDASSHEGPPPDEPPDEIVPPDGPDVPDGPDELVETSPGETWKGGKAMLLVRMRWGKTEQCSKQGRWSKLKQSYLTWPLH